jgi:hypothetical protein
MRLNAEETERYYWMCGPTCQTHRRTFLNPVVSEFPRYVETRTLSRKTHERHYQQAELLRA